VILTSDATAVMTEDEAIELFAFLITSARSQLDDPCRYASMRLLTAAEELRHRIVDRVTPDTRAILRATEPKTSFAQTHTNDLEAYTAALDELCAETAGFLVERFGGSATDDV
jgi:hypothetical protein